MTSFYLRQADGADADDGLTWANAKQNLSNVGSTALSGDIVYADKNLANSLVATTTITFAGTIAAPIKLYSVNSAGDPQPPTLAEAGAAVETTGGFSLTLNGSFYAYGWTFRAGATSNSSSITFRFNGSDGHHQRLENCVIHSASTGTSNVDFGLSSSTVEGLTELRNTNFIFGSANSSLRAYSKLRWDGGELASGTAAITNLFKTAAMGIDVRVTGVDLSRGSASMNILDTGVSQYGDFLIRNSKLPPSWGGKLLNGDPLNTGLRARMHNCSSGSTVYRTWEEDLLGKDVDDTTVFLSGGSTDGVPYSHKITTKANASFPNSPFISAELPAKWNTTVGASVTVTVEILADSAANLTNEEVWLEVQYYSGTDAKTSVVSSAKATPLAAATTVPVSTATWTSPGVAAPKKQKMSVTFTPQKAGFIQGRVCVAKPSATVFYDRRFIVS